MKGRIIYSTRVGQSVYRKLPSLLSSASSEFDTFELSATEIRLPHWLNSGIILPNKSTFGTKF